MRPRVRAVVLCVAMGALVSGCSWWDGPEKHIRRMLEAVADRLSHDAPLTLLAAAARAAEIQEYVSPQVVIEVGRPLRALRGRDDALAAATRILASTPSLRVRFVDVAITLGDNDGEAQVGCSATALVVDGKGQETRDARELNLIVRRVEGRWTIEHVKAVNIVEPVS